MGGEHSSHPSVALAGDLAGTLHGHLPLSGQGEGIEVLGEVIAAPISYAVSMAACR